MTDVKPDARWRFVRLFQSELTAEAIRLARTPAFLPAIVLLPVVVYYLLGVLVVGPGASGDLRLRTFVGFAVYGIMGPGVFGFGTLLASDRSLGFIRYRCALPSPMAYYLAAKVAAATIFSAVIAGAVICTGVAAGQLHVPLVHLILLEFVLASGMAPASAIGFLIGASAPPAAAPAFANMTYVALSMLTGLFFPLPPAIAAIGTWLPSHQIAQIALEVCQGSGGGLHHLTPVLTLAAETLVCSIAAGIALRRSIFGTPRVSWVPAPFLRRPA